MESDGQRILLDLGTPLDAEEGSAPLPEVPGIREDGDRSLLGVLVSHLHGDHCGLVPFARPGLPMGIGAKASGILRRAEFFTKRMPLPAPTWILRDRETLEIGPFRITPYQVEHSALDAFALLIEAAGRRLFYTGDFRAHGNDRGPWERLLENPPREVHALLMEGTQVADGRDGEGPTEADLRRALARRFKDWPGLVLAAWSSQNLDRLRTMYEAAQEAGRVLAIDLYTATLAMCAAQAGVPVPGAKGLEVYCRRRERIQIKESGEFERVRQIGRVRVYPEELGARAHELVLMLRPSMAAELELAGALDGALAIWSLWRGYLEGPSEKRLLDVLARHGVALDVQHVSGHAYVGDLKRLVEAVAPAAVVPIHSESPERYAELFPNVKVRADGEWWEVHAGKGERSA